jgi:hypothetical protein
LPPHGIRPSADEEAPKRRATTKPKPAAASAKKPAATAAPRTTGGMSDADLRARLVESYETLGTLMAGMGYMRRNPGLALAGFNVIASAGEQADIDVRTCRTNPRLRALLVRFLDSSATMQFVGAKVALAAPALAAFAPHPFVTGIANRAIKPEAHVMALEAMPDLFVTPEPAPDPAATNAAVP